MKLKFVISYFLLFCTVVSCDTTTTGDVGTKTKDTIPAHVEALIVQIKVNPDDVNTRLTLANTLDSIGLYTMALTQMDSLIVRDNNNYDLWFNKARICSHAKDTLSAIHCFNNAIRIYPSPDALLSVANLYAETKNNTCLPICKRVRDMRIGREYDAHCAFIEGVYHARMGHKETAIQLFDKCITNNYTYMEAHIEKGLVYFDNKQYEKALQVFQFSSTVNTLYADAYYYMARSYEMMHQKDSAILRFRQSLSLDKSLKEAKEGLERLE